RRLEAEQLAQPPLRLPRVDQLLDGGDRVAPLEQVEDQLEPLDVDPAVHRPPALTPRLWKQPALLVEADVADGRTRFPGQLVDRELVDRIGVHVTTVTAVAT